MKETMTKSFSQWKIAVTRDEGGESTAGDTDAEKGETEIIAGTLGEFFGDAVGVLLFFPFFFCHIEQRIS